MFLSVKNDNFLVNGVPGRVLSGALHYFRIPPEYWRDRLKKARFLGLNAVETYVAWNLHEPKPGEFDFSGGLDIARFVKTAGEEGLMVIVRPGPYVCTEWDLGGLPPWLLADPTMRLRCAWPPYLKAVDRYLDALMPQLEPLFGHHGGPIVAMQVENEYGSYGNDKVYLQHLENGLHRRGFRGLLFTSDGACDWMLQGGTLPYVFKVANFGSGATGQFAKLREWQPKGPMMCGEFWNGWFNHFGETRTERSPEDAAGALDELLGCGASVNLYMLQGGTSFGFMAGANHGAGYEPDISSYDYDAPLDEAGDPTPKYWAMREVIGKYTELPAGELPPVKPKGAYGPVDMTASAPLFANLKWLSKPTESPAPLTFEEIGLNYGFMVYRTTVTGPREKCRLNVHDLHDFAVARVDGEIVGSMYRNGGTDPIELAFGPGDHTLELLVEGMGRVNYGPRLFDRKGVTEGILLGQQFLYGWSHFSLPLTEELSDLTWETFEPKAEPCFYRGEFTVDEPRDTYLALPGWRKGVVFVNGVNLGRYWEIGPQKTWFVPATILSQGVNEVVIFELLGAGGTPELRDAPEWDSPKTQTK